jgi:hypothetical protein
MTNHPAVPMSISAAIKRTSQALSQSKFPEHASPDSIRDYLRDATQARAALERHTAWLTALSVERAEQVIAGTWPVVRDETGAGAA